MKSIMASKRQKLFLLYYISRASLFGLGYSRMFALTKQDTWISAMIGLGIGLIIVFMISKIMNNKKYINNKIIICILIILYSFFISEELTTLMNFMTSFFLLNTPNYIISLAAIIVSLYVVSKGIKSILRTGEIVFYFNIFITITTLVILCSYINISHLFPILDSSVTSIVKSSIIFALYTTIPLINLLNLENKGQGLTKMYLISSLTIIMLIICVLGIFGPRLTEILRFPEYIVLKRIKLLSFIEKIESILSITYIIDNLMLIIISTYNIKYLVKDNKIAFYVIILVTYLFSAIIINGNYINALKIYYITPYIFIIGLILIIYYFINSIKKKPKASYIQRDT